MDRSSAGPTSSSSPTSTGKRRAVVVVAETQRPCYGSSSLAISSLQPDATREDFMLAAAGAATAPDNSSSLPLLPSSTTGLAGTELAGRGGGEEEQTKNTEPTRGVRKTSSLRRGAAGYDQLLRSAVMASIETQRKQSSSKMKKYSMMMKKKDGSMDMMTMVDMDMSSCDSSDDIDEEIMSSGLGDDGGEAVPPPAMPLVANVSMDGSRSFFQQYHQNESLSCCLGQDKDDSTIVQKQRLEQRKRSRRGNEDGDHDDHDYNTTRHMTIATQRPHSEEKESQDDENIAFGGVLPSYDINSSSMLFDTTTAAVPTTTTNATASTMMMPRKVSCTGKSSHHRYHYNHDDNDHHEVWTTGPGEGEGGGGGGAETTRDIYMEEF